MSVKNKSNRFEIIKNEINNLLSQQCPFVEINNGRFLFLNKKTEESAKEKELLKRNEYLNTVYNDLEIILSDIKDISKHENEEILPFPYEINYSISKDVFFDVTIKQQDVEKIIDIEVTIGSFLIIEDLIYRAGCNKDFFSFDVEKNNERQWKGTNCFWFYRYGIFQPESRYYDYHQKEGANLTGSFLSSFFNAIPLEDNNRIKVINFIIKIELTWVLMHEEGHHIEGHLLYEKERVNSNKPLSEMDYIGINNLEHKTIEWEADRSATHAVIDIFFKDDFFDKLPCYCGNNRVGWLLRLILISIGSTALIFQKAQYEYSTDTSGYPNIKTRLVSSFIHAIARINENTEKNWEYTILIDFKNTNTLKLIETSILGALDDLNTLSILINEESHLNIWSNDGDPPKINKGQPVGILDSIQETKNTASIILNILFPYIFSKEVSYDLSSMSDDWFPDWKEIVNYHNHVLYNKLKPYRSVVTQPDRNLKKIHDIILSNGYIYCIKKINKSLKLCRSDADFKVFRKILNIIYNESLEAGKINDAENILQVIINTPFSLKEYWFLAIALSNFGNLKRIQGINDVAIRYFNEALKNFDHTIGMEDSIADTYNNIGLSCGQLGKYKERIFFLEKAAEIKESIGNYQGAAIAHQNLSIAYSQKEHWGEALKEEKKRLNMLQKSNVYDISITECIFSIININAKHFKNIEELIKYCEIGIDYSKKIKNVRWILAFEDTLKIVSKI